jgi:hypothetical protein
LLSIDIDGNDYWVWEALNVIEPRVVIIETNRTFGMRNIVVPYDKDYRRPGKHALYSGASPAAMEKLAKRKGYRLVGANNYGINMIFVIQGIAEDILPSVSVDSILQHPSRMDCESLFEPIRDWPFVVIEYNNQI